VAPEYWIGLVFVVLFLLFALALLFEPTAGRGGR
jgi:hypothetical protein